MHGIKTGGDRKLVLFSSAHDKPQIKPSANPRLQKLVQDIISGCSKSYSNVDLDEMEQRYGFAQFSRSEEPLSELPDHTAAGILDFESNDDIVRAATPEPDSSVQTAPTDQKDPCVVEGFLSEVGNLLDLLKRHAATQLSHSDKARDQFPARKHEDVNCGPNQAGSSRIGTFSTMGTVLSSSGSHPGSVDSRKRTRIASGAQAKGAAGRHLDSVHRDKRIK